MPTNHDVTDRIEAQRENAESQRMFEVLFDNSDAAIIDHDFSILFRAVQDLKRNGVTDLRRYVAESDERLTKLVDVVQINNANKAAFKMLGVSSLQELGKRSTNILEIAEAMFIGETSLRRSEYIAAGNSRIPVVYTLRIPESEAEAQRVPIVIMDLSDIKLAEAARQATIAKSNFLSSMSHEIRTPLNGLIGNLELLALTNIDDEQIELIEDADKAGKALLALIGNILDFSKIEAGKLTIEMSDINPAALVEESVDVLQSRGRLKNIFVAAVIAPDVPSLIRGDAMRVRQILLNLIGNAVKFTEKGGVQVNLAVTAWHDQACELRFEVHDSGRGIDRIQEGRLFEPFSQGEAMADWVEGTGLGLSICNSLVAAFGGTIGCEGVPGEGATFWFTMPAAVVRRAPPVTPPDLSEIKVMIIGHGGDTAMPLESYFRARGASLVTEAEQAALELVAESGDGDISIVDVAIVVPDGGDDDNLEIAWRLRQQHIVPLLYGTDPAPRTRLRQGFAAVVPPDADALYLDRNIRFLVGHAKARDRLVAHQEIYASAFRSDLAGKRVLVLEDRLVNQVVIQKQLKKLGIECVLVADGVKGLNLLDRQQFDLILCDCSMPVMNGYDFTRALRKREQADGIGRHMPVIALTANAFREDADKCRESGMDDFISKPVTMDRLTTMLVRWLTSLDSASASAEQRKSDESGEAPIIEMAALAEILGTDDPQTLNEVLAEFLAAAGTSLSAVQAAVSSGDADASRDAAHGAKGEARSAAANRLADLYADLERGAKSKDHAASRALIARIAAEMALVEGFIRVRLESSSS